jgi:hypothetical protein
MLYTDATPLIVRARHLDEGRVGAIVRGRLGHQGIVIARNADDIMVLHELLELHQLTARGFDRATLGFIGHRLGRTGRERPLRQVRGAFRFQRIGIAL